MTGPGACDQDISHVFLFLKDGCELDPTLLMDSSKLSARFVGVKRPQWQQLATRCWLLSGSYYFIAKQL